METCWLRPARGLAHFEELNLASRRLYPLSQFIEFSVQKQAVSEKVYCYYLNIYRGKCHTVLRADKNEQREKKDAHSRSGNFGDLPTNNRPVGGVCYIWNSIGLSKQLKNKEK
jgi:hypothetical protein